MIKDYNECTTMLLPIEAPYVRICIPNGKTQDIIDIAFINHDEFWGIVAGDPEKRTERYITRIKLNGNDTIDFKTKRNDKLYEFVVTIYETYYMVIYK